MNVAAGIQTSLYRHYAEDGTLLYVGISLSWPARTKQHASGSRWFAEVARVTIERFPSREAALEAEREAIKREKPKFNVVHNRQRDVRPRRQFKQSDLAIVSESSLSLLSSKERRRYREQLLSRNPLLRKITGPHAIVGPALVYRGDTISLLVAHGVFGTPGELTEVVLGERFPDLPAWTDACGSVLTIRRPDEITLEEAEGQRANIIATLRLHLEEVQAFETDLALATAYATQFPSDKSRRVLDDVAAEKAAR
jgi:predicted GIY-YIG superfamily endonuclease